MEGKSFEEGLAEITKTLKRLQSTLLFHQTKLKESFRQARQDFSLARRDISLATKKLHRSIKAAIKEEVDHEEQFDFLGVQLNQRIPNRTVKARKVKARLFWRKFIVIIDRTRRPKSIQSEVMLRLGHHHLSVARGNIRVLGLNVQRVRQHPPRLVYQVCYWPILHYKGNQRQIWDPRITWLKISKEHLEDKGVIPAIPMFSHALNIATEKLHGSIKAAIKEEVDHEEQFNFLGVQLNQRIPNRTLKARKVKARLGHHHPSVARGNIRVLGLNVQREIKDKFRISESRGSRFQRSTLRTRNFPSREGMEGKSFEEGLAEITETLKWLQSMMLFHQTKLKESFRQARQDFSLAHRDISLATEKLHRLIKTTIKEEVDHEEQFNFLGVQLNQRIPNRTVKARKVKARLFWRKFIVTIDRIRRPKSIQSVVMLRLGHRHPSVACGNIRVLGLNVQRIIFVRPTSGREFCFAITQLSRRLLGYSNSHVFPCAEHSAARATTFQHFQKAMENMKKFNEEAFNWLNQIPPQHWSKSHFSPRPHSDVLLNNMCECFNSKILDGRDMPIIAAIDYIREYLMKRIVNVIRVIEKCDGPLTPTATRLLETVKKEASDYGLE
ncbi:hypothetical protein Tco_1476302 [Tanacetum coccineum]